MGQAPPIWRRGGCIWLLEHRPGALAPLERLSSEWPVRCTRTHAAVLPGTHRPDAVVVEIDEGSPQIAARLAARWTRHPPPLVGYAEEATPLALSRAAALGCAELLHPAASPEDIAQVLARACELGVLRRELVARLTLLDQFREDPAREGEAAAPLSAVLLIGRPGPEQVEIARAIGTARLTYSDGIEGIDWRPFDLLVATGRSAEELAARLHERSAPDTPLLVAYGEAGQGPSHIGSRGSGGLPWFDPFIGSERLRLLLEFWVAFGRTRRLLRDLPDPVLHPLAHDPLTGLANFAFFAAYLDALLACGGHGLPLLGIHLGRLDEVNRDAGFAAGNLLLRRAGRVLRQGCRSEDFIARISGGSFACLPSAATEEGAEAMQRRLLRLFTSEEQLGKPQPPVIARYELRRSDDVLGAIRRLRRNLDSQDRRVA